MSNPKPQKRTTNSSGSFFGSGETSVQTYRRLYGKLPTKDQLSEMQFNLIGYVELLIQLDRQHGEWLKEQSKDTPA